MSTVAEEWDGYRAKVVPASAGEVQVRETRQAFYAGATAMFSLIIRNNADEGLAEDVAEDLALTRLSAWQDELYAFRDEVRALVQAMKEPPP